MVRTAETTRQGVGFAERHSAGNSIDDLKMFERWDTQRNLYVQNWNDLASEFVGQNPYWINYRNVRTNRKYRYMLNLGASYKLTDYLSLAARIRVHNATVDMGEPMLSNTTQVSTPSGDLAGVSIHVTDQTFQATYVCMGNPHVVIFVDDISRIPVETYGPEIEFSPLFPSARHASV